VRHRLLFLAAAAVASTIFALAVTFERLEEGRRISTQDLIDLNTLAVARMENNWGELLHEQGRLDEAEPRYKNALATYRRLHRDDYAAPALLDLGRLLITRSQQAGRNAEEDYAEAETSLLDALEVFKARGRAEYEEQRAALLLLQTLYSPAYWHDEDSLIRIEGQLGELEQAIGKSAPAPNL
jgi:tetratricopeptide (TPR) repeat protein